MSPPGHESAKRSPGKRPERACFLCLAPDCESQCPHCRAVHYCGEEHFRLHRAPDDDYCFPYEADYLDGVGKLSCGSEGLLVVITKVLGYYIEAL